MNTLARPLFVLLLIFAILSTALPCGPGYVTPVFDFTKSPEQPYTGFAAGQLGIIKPTFHRSILFAAYRYLNGGSFSPEDQRFLVDLWRAEVDRDYPNQDDIGEIVKIWVERRKTVAAKDEKLPEIYVERSYGGYDFFPNCTANAFEVATQTLSDRSSAYGAADPAVQNWLAAQDDVFMNCSSGKRIPEAAPPGSPEWLQKDRAYQIAAAEFYALDFNSAKRHFAEIAQDTQSPWQETADYLVARTLIRQASLSSSPTAALPLFEEAESHLERFVSRSGKFTPSAERMIGLVRYRTRPKERVSELARKLMFQTGNENFKQDLVDYTWLLDKFESQALEAEFKRKQAIEAAKTGATPLPEATPEKTETVDSNKLNFTIYSEDYSTSWPITVPVDATDAETLVEAQRVMGKPLTDDMKKRVTEGRQSAYSNRFTANQQPSYEGGYYSEDKLELSALPAFLRNDDLTDWLFATQNASPASYRYIVKRFIDTGNEAWLVSAMMQAQKDSPELARIMEAADRVPGISPGYQTVAYHRARLLLETGKLAEARTLIDDVLTRGDVPVSTVNSFTALRLQLADSLDDFITYSLRRPFAFDFSGSVGSIDEMVAKEKTYFDPEYNKEGREAYEKEIDDRYKDERLWQDRKMLPSESIDQMNRVFPQSLLVDVEKSPALPDYLRTKFVIAIWTRAYLLDDFATMLKFTPQLAAYDPAIEPQLEPILSAKTQAALDRAALFFILKNPVLSPYLEDGMGKSDNEFEQWSSNDWWCSSYLDTEYDTPKVIKEPKFLTPALKAAALAERKKLIELGDAPAMLAARVIEWAKRAPTDKRVPEALYIVHAANGWTKYGCGSSEETQAAIEAILKKSYPSSPWTRKLETDKTEQSGQ